MKVEVTETVTRVYTFDAEDFRSRYEAEWHEEERPELESWIPDVMSREGTGPLQNVGKEGWIHYSEDADLEVSIRQRVEVVK